MSSSAHPSHLRRGTLLCTNTDIATQLVTCLSFEGPLDTRNLHRSKCRNTLIYAHATLRNLPPCDKGLDSPTGAIPEAGDFVELLQLYTKSQEGQLVENCNYWTNIIYAANCPYIYVRPNNSFYPPRLTQNAVLEISRLSDYTVSYSM